MIPSPERSDLLQEEDHVSRRDVILGMLAVLAVSAVMIIWAWATTEVGLAARRPAGELAEARLGPRRDVEGVREAIFRHGGVGEVREARPERALEVYRWLDPERRIVTLPIDQAMDRIAEESAR